MILKYRGKENYAPKPPVALQGAGAVLGKPDEMLHVLVDTREQLPCDFNPLYVDAKRGTIPVGDYALQNDEMNYSLERKNLSDFIQAVVLSQSLRREKAKIEKMAARLLPVHYIIEANWMDLQRYDYSVFKSGRVHSQFVCRQWARLSYKNGVCFDWAGDKEGASYMICLLLKQRLEELRGLTPSPAAGVK